MSPGRRYAWEKSYPARGTLMSSTAAERRGLEPLGTFRGFAVAGCEPDEMGIGPVFAVPKLLQPVSGYLYLRPRVASSTTMAPSPTGRSPESAHHVPATYL